jgi:hypothetical protein
MVNLSRDATADWKQTFPERYSKAYPADSETISNLCIVVTMGHHCENALFRKVVGPNT